MTNKDRHDLRNLRDFTRSNFRERRGEESYHRALRVREEKLSESARKAWHEWSSSTLTRVLEETETAIETVEGATLIEKGGRYVMTAPSGSSHDISSDPAITSEARLSAHWEGFLRNHGIEKARSISDLSRDDLVEGIREAKKAATDRDTFAAGGFQVIAADKDGERLGDPFLYSDRNQAVPALRDLKKVFASDPAITTLTVEGMILTEWEDGNAIERRRDCEPSGEWWGFTVAR
jgi:hypothetical protein